MHFDFSVVKKVHCLGIGGIGVSALAKFFLAQGKEVSGSDTSPSEITADLEKRGIKIFYGHREDNLPAGIDLAIYSPAVPADNPERLKIKRLNVPELSYPEFLGELSKNYHTIAVSGTHGKSTTAALIGLMLEAAGFDPLVIVGSLVPNWESGNIRLPQKKPGRYFVVEACEHQANMLKINPQTAVVTNIEADHLDYYKNFENIETAFEKFVESAKKDGGAIINGDSLKSLIEHCQSWKDGRKLKTFGLGDQCDYQATDLQAGPGRQEFKVNGIEFKIHLPGRFNVYNALAATAAAATAGAPLEICRRVLFDFKGIWRRFEKVGEREGALIISDYGHHPTAVAETVRASREFYPDRRLVLIFQPHQHNRTKTLYNDFLKVLTGPDLLILSDIYDVAGREAAVDQDVSSAGLIESLKIADSSHPAKYLYGGDLEKTETLARDLIQRGDLALVMGAGDIDKIARRLVC